MRQDGSCSPPPHSAQSTTVVNKSSQKDFVGITGDLHTVLKVSQHAARRRPPAWSLWSMFVIAMCYRHTVSPGAEKAHVVGFPPTLLSLIEHH